MGGKEKEGRVGGRGNGREGKAERMWRGPESGLPRGPCWLSAGLPRGRLGGMIGKVGSAAYGEIEDKEGAMYWVNVSDSSGAGVVLVVKRLLLLLYKQHAVGSRYLWLWRPLTL